MMILTSLERSSKLTLTLGGKVGFWRLFPLFQEITFGGLDWHPKEGKGSLGGMVY